MVAVAPGDRRHRRHQRPRHRDRHDSPTKVSEQMSETDAPDQGGRHRLRQHRHRPDDQGPAALRDPRDARAMVGIDPDSDGLARAARLGVPTTHEGVDGLIAMDGFDDIEIVFDATSAGAHRANAAKLAPYGKKLVDLTPAAIGPYVVPPVNLDDAPGRRQRQHGHLRRAGHDPDRGRRLAGHRGALRRDRRLDRLEVGRARHPRQHRRVHRDHGARPSRRSAAPARARRSSSSTPPSRR